MSDLPERPRVRPVEIKPAIHEGERIFILRDPLRLSDGGPLVLGLPGLALAELLDGTRTIGDVKTAFLLRYGLPIGSEQIETLVRALDEALLLESDRVRALMDEWRKQPLREPACAGGSYPDDPTELRKFLDEQFTRPGGPGEKPSRTSKAAPVRSVISPHIDFHRGGACYAWAWKAVQEACEADLFVVFGTAHHGTGSSRFALTKKSYDTPLGTISTDVDLVEKLAKTYEGPDDLFASEFMHKGEHSIEFQMVELASIYGDRKVRALPVLVGSIGDLMEGPKQPSQEPRIRAFQDALAKVLEGEKRVCFVAGVDLAHVGSDFEDPPLTEQALARVLEQDRSTLDVVLRGDPDAFHADVARDDDARRICGHAPIASVLDAQRRHSRLTGELLRHDRWYDGASSVTFASVVYRDRPRSHA